MEKVLESPKAEIYGPEAGFNLEMPSFPDLPEYFVSGYIPDQRYHLEVWAEKTTMNDILMPLCQQYGANLITGVGELSITSVQWLFDRMINLEKPCRIFYVSDFDPAGRSMPVAIARKIEKFIYDSGRSFDIRLTPMVLTPEQCVEYQLPRTPIKKKEKRAGKFEARFGEGATELDALEALHPGEFRRIVSDAIRKYRDPQLNSRVYEVQSELEEHMDSTAENIIGKYSDQINELRSEYNAVAKEFESKISNLSGRITNVWQAITEEMDTILEDICLPEVPQADEAEETTTDLYNSDRGYFEQISEYKRFQGEASPLAGN